MCGILYSQDSNGFSDLEMLKRRGPEGFTEQSNNLGYFAHSMLNTIGENTAQPYETKSGILLYNGSTYNSDGGNDTAWIGKKLDENLDNTLNILRELTGEYALIYVTEKNVVFCVDHFDSRNLWFYHNKDERQLTVASLPNVVEQKNQASWRAEGNKIYIMDRHDFSIRVDTNKIFDLEQKIDHFDFVFEKFEKGIRARYKPFDSTLLISSGFDSGVVACATNKFFESIDCVSDPRGEELDIIKERMGVHKITILPNFKGHMYEKEIMYHEILPRDDLWEDSSTDALINLMKGCVVKHNKKIILFGNGGDEIYNDWQGQIAGTKWTRTNGSFPPSLQLVWPWHNYYGRMQLTNSRTDFIAGYFGLETRNPLLDVDLVQAWLNTTHKMKVQGYKSWMKAYMDQEKYPYTMKKVHWCNPHITDYKMPSWKLTNKNKLQKD